MWTKDIFGTEKPIIALLHLDALPGEPAFAGDLDLIMEHARVDLQALQDGGVDGILIANEYCFPITPKTDTVELMSMSAIIGYIKKDIRVPFGTNVVYNPIETIKMAATLGAAFGRSAFGGAFSGAYGTYITDFGESVRLKYQLGHPEIQLLCKFNPEGDARIGELTNKAAVAALCEGGFAGGLCVSGPGAGQDANMDMLAEVTQLAHAYNTPVFCNTGTKHSTIEAILQIADGACVGTALKGADGRVDIEKVRSFMEIVHRVRGDK